MVNSIGCISDKFVDRFSRQRACVEIEKELRIVLEKKTQLKITVSGINDN